MIPLAHHEFDGSHRGLRHTLGEMTIVCGKCGALHFLEKRAASSSCANPQFTLCYTQGKVTMPPLAPPPEPLRQFLTSKKMDAKDFRQHICSYNSVLAFTSVGANLDTSVAQLVLPNLVIILTVFTVSFTIGWGVYFFNLVRRENSPNYTLTIGMPSSMAGWVILVA
jgi:hypothetical protein